MTQVAHSELQAADTVSAHTQACTPQTPTDTQHVDTPPGCKAPRPLPEPSPRQEEPRQESALCAPRLQERGAEEGSPRA